MRVVSMLRDLRKAPWTLWASVVFSLLSSLVYGVVFGRPHLWLWPLGLLFEAVVAFFLLRGARWMWWFLVVGGLAVIPLDVIGPHPGWSVTVQIISAAFLLAPQSRRYVFKPEPPSVLPGPPQAVGYSNDDAPPPGWYFDPNDDRRMRYWDASLGGWQSKTTRAPRRR